MTPDEVMQYANDKFDEMKQFFMDNQVLGLFTIIIRQPTQEGHIGMGILTCDDMNEVVDNLQEMQKANVGRHPMTQPVGKFANAPLVQDGKVIRREKFDA